MWSRSILTRLRLHLVKMAALASAKKGGSGSTKLPKGQTVTKKKLLTGHLKHPNCYQMADKATLQTVTKC